MARSRKTIEDVRTLALKRKLRCLDEIYINNSTKMTFEDEEGYKYNVTYQNLRIANKLDRFSKNNKYTIDNIKNWLRLNNPKLKLISNTYTNMNDKNIYLKCRKCGLEYAISLCNLVSHGSNCKKCSKYKKPLKYNTDTVQELLSKRGIIIQGEYKGIKSRTTCSCVKCGFEWEAYFDSLINGGKGCPECNRNRLKGETNPSWKGGITPLQNNIRTSMLPWKIDSYKKYNHCCDITGIKLNSNVIHHHHNFRDILLETLDKLNMRVERNISDYSEKELELIKSKCLELHYKYGLGICLTVELHKEFHSIYGVKNNTLEQYLEFKENKLKEIKESER